MYLLINGILLLLLLAAAWQDFRSYHIRNVLVFSGALLGILLNTFLSEGIGIFESTVGWVVGLLLLLPLYMLRMLGAGDVKLMAMVGAFVGPYDVIWVLFSTLIMGGVLAVVVSLRRGMLGRLFENITMMFLLALSVDKSRPLVRNLSVLEEAPESVGKLPYGIAIAVGTTIFLIVNNY